MIRPLTIVSFLMACGSGLYLYQSKHEVQMLDRTIEKTVRDTGVLREQSRLLATEWTMLNDPETLRRFSDRYLALHTIVPSQFSSLADLDNRLPPVPAEDPEDAPPAVAENGAAPPQVPVEPAPPIATEDALPTPPLPVAPPLPASANMAPGTAPAHPAERKATASKPMAADTVYKPAAVATADRLALAEPPAFNRAAFGTDLSRATESHAHEQRSADQRAAHPGEGRLTGPKATEPRGSTANTVLRPVIAVAPPRPQPVSPPSDTIAPHGPSGAGFPGAGLPGAGFPGGSLLGVARGPLAPPVPRPKPVNLTQLYNAN